MMLRIKKIKPLTQDVHTETEIIDELSDSDCGNTGFGSIGV